MRDEFLYLVYNCGRNRSICCRWSLDQSSDIATTTTASNNNDNVARSETTAKDNLYSPHQTAIACYYTYTAISPTTNIYVDECEWYAAPRSLFNQCSSRLVILGQQYTQHARTIESVGQLIHTCRMCYLAAGRPMVVLLKPPLRSLLVHWRCGYRDDYARSPHWIGLNHGSDPIDVCHLMLSGILDW